MGLTKYTVRYFRFTCDEPGCGRTVEIRLSRKREALRDLRYYGWKYNSGNGRTYCREHRR